MRRPPIVRLVPAAATVLLLTVLGACGGGDSSSASDGGGSAGPASSAGSDGSAPADDASTTVLDTCDVISVDEVGAIVGGTFTSELGPFDACEFDQDDPRATSFSLDAQPLAELGGGFEVYRSGSAQALTGAQQVDVPDVGDEAFITTGTFGDGPNTQLQAAVLAGGQVLTFSLTQGSGVAADVLVDQATQLMTLVASRL